MITVSVCSIEPILSRYCCQVTLSLSTGNELRCDHILSTFLSRQLPPQVAVRAGDLSHVPPKGQTHPGSERGFGWRCGRERRRTRSGCTDTSFKTPKTTCRERLVETTQLLIPPSSRRRGKGQREELVTQKIKLNQLNYKERPLKVFGSAPMETLLDLSTHRPAGLQRSLLVPMCTKGKPLPPTGRAQVRTVWRTHHCCRLLMTWIQWRSCVTLPEQDSETGLVFVFEGHKMAVVVMTAVMGHIHCAQTSISQN